jgi:hypothetical protein
VRALIESNREPEVKNPPTVKEVRGRTAAVTRTVHRVPAGIAPKLLCGFFHAPAALLRVQGCLWAAAVGGIVER